MLLSDLEDQCSELIDKYGDGPVFNMLSDFIKTEAGSLEVYINPDLEMPNYYYLKDE